MGNKNEILVCKGKFDKWLDLEMNYLLHKESVRCDLKEKKALELIDLKTSMRR